MTEILLRFEASGQFSIVGIYYSDGQKKSILNLELRREQFTPQQTTNILETLTHKRIPYTINTIMHSALENNLPI